MYFSKSDQWPEDRNRIFQNWSVQKRLLRILTWSISVLGKIHKSISSGFDHGFFFLHIANRKLTHPSTQILGTSLKKSDWAWSNGGITNRQIVYNILYINSYLEWSWKVMNEIIRNWRIEKNWAQTSLGLRFVYIRNKNCVN